jgi:hypothetical protein
LILTRQIPAIEPDPSNELALFWNPAGASFEQALHTLGTPARSVAIIGGTDDYLQSCGVTAKYSESDPKIYWCEGKRVRLSHVVVVANRQRRTQQLPPFAVQP